MSSRNPEAFEFKAVMADAIEASGIPKKVIAIDLGVSGPDLSHWLSDKTGFTMPGHLIPRFCEIVRDNSLIWHVQSAYERRGKAS